MSNTVYYTREGDMLDHLCYLHYGVQEGAVEHVLATNTHLHALPMRLPHKVAILFSELSVLTEKPKVRLWDYDSSETSFPR